MRLLELRSVSAFATADFFAVWDRPRETLAADLSEPDAVARATASDPKALSRQQAAVAQWLSRRYRVAPEPVSRRCNPRMRGMLQNVHG